MLETEFQENEATPWVQKILKELNVSPAQFKNKTDAIAALEAELNDIATKRSTSVPKLLELASSSVENHEDLDRSLRLSSLIYSLKNS